MFKVLKCAIKTIGEIFTENNNNLKGFQFQYIIIYFNGINQYLKTTIITKYCVEPELTFFPRKSWFYEIYIVSNVIARTGRDDSYIDV